MLITRYQGKLHHFATGEDLRTFLRAIFPAVKNTAKATLCIVFTGMAQSIGIYLTGGF